jgi:hypothetical protein
MSKLVDQYYKITRESEAKEFRRGQLCWGPSLFAPNKLATLELIEYNPKNEQLNRYAVLPLYKIGKAAYS